MKKRIVYNPFTGFLDLINAGDVVGPSSSTDTALVRWDGSSGKLIQNSGVLLDASDNMTGVSSLNIDGTTTTSHAFWVQAGSGRFDGRLLKGQGADVASANDLTLGADGNCFEITGTTQVNAITTSGWQNGSVVTLLFTSTPTVKHNTAGGAGTVPILLSGATDFSAVAGSKLVLQLSEIGGTQAWREIDCSSVQTITFIIDGGGSAITTGVKGDLEIPYNCKIKSATLLADQSGSIVIDIWKDTYANYPPTVADTITASAKPTISSATKSQDTTLTGWTTSITAGDTLRFNVDSITTCTRVTLSLKVIKS